MYSTKRSSKDKYRNNEDLSNKAFRSSDSDGFSVKANPLPSLQKKKNIKVDVPLTEGIRYRKFMAVELACYNHLVSNIGAQFHRDHTLFLDITPEQLGLFSHMCLEPYNIYENSKQVPQSYVMYAEAIQTLDNKKKYLFSECAKQFGIIPEIRRRMGASILWFYMTQANIRYNNRYIFKKEEEESAQHSKVAYATLSTVTSFHKRHLQIDRKSCKVDHDNTTNTTSIITPYSKIPLTFTKSETNNKWNYLVLKQPSDVETTYGDWSVDLKKIDDNGYLINFMNRHGHSSIFETAKMRLVKK